MDLGSVDIENLAQMMETSNMKQFCATAKELVGRKSEDAYEVLKRYVYSSDIYKRRYILSIIFEYPYAIELKEELDKALRIENAKSFMTTTILEVLIKYNIEIDSKIIVQVLKNSSMDSGWNYQVIRTFDNNDKNLKMLLELYRIKGTCTSIRISMAEQLLRFAKEENYMQLFQLFEKDEQPHIRIIACEIAKKMNRQDLMILFKDDKDGHIRNYVMRNMKI